MTDFCLICETEAIERVGWVYDQETTEAICPWCIKEGRERYLTEQSNQTAKCN